jgi:octaprenyl-diphosphate synthase
MATPALYSSLADVTALDRVFELVRPHNAALTRYLDEQVAAFEPEVQPLVKFTLQHSGKRLRPLLVFIGGWQGDEAAPDPQQIKAAAVVELVHLATLVHDDILDEATTRHRTATVTAKYGPHAAVLVGDALFAHALELASTFPTTDVCRLVSSATRAVCSGEIAQTFARGRTDLSIDQYYRLIDLKTAELFALSAELGARLAGHPPAVVTALARCARQLGIAYQIFDDIADLLGHQSAAGKTLGTDLASGKFTLPLLLWFASMPAATAQQTAAQLRAGQVADWATALRAGGHIAATKQAFDHQLQIGLDALAACPTVPATHLLPPLAAFVNDACNKLLAADAQQPPHSTHGQS